MLLNCNSNQSKPNPILFIHFRTPLQPKYPNRLVFNNFRTLSPKTAGTTSPFDEGTHPQRPSRPRTSAKFFTCHTSEKCARKPNHCHTSRIIGLKVLSLPHLRKSRGMPSRIAFVASLLPCFRTFLDRKST